MDEQSDGSRDGRASLRLSIAPHGHAGWCWTMEIDTEDGFAVMAEFRSGPDGRGSWIRMAGEPDEAWTMVMPPEQRRFPTDADEAREEIEQLCVAVAADLVRVARARQGTDLEFMRIAGTC